MPISKKPYAIERIVSSATYLTAGGAGLVWLIIAAFLRKQVTPFLMYHILQSFFLSMGFLLFTIFMELIYNIFCRIPILNIISNIILFFNISIIYKLSILQIFTSSVILYLSLTAAMGYYSYIPWFSDIIKNNTGQR